MTARIVLPNIGTGTMRTPGSYAALLISTEENKGTQIDIVNAIIDALGISMAELSHYRQRPDCCFEEEYEKWRSEAERLRDMCDIETEGNDQRDAG